MLIGSIPTRIAVPFGESAVAPYIRDVPVDSQIGITAGAASFETGFVPDNFTAIEAGGVPPFGADFNGLLLRVTEWLRWTQAGAPIAYDATFQTDIGGYPLGAVVASAATFGLYFVSTVDGNTTDPDAEGAGWLSVPLASGGVLSTGAWTWRPTAEDIPGWTKANGTTIGSAASLATQLASATAYPQFKWLWTNFSNTQCPVSTGRGANPAADFAANKTITVLDMRAMAPIGMDTMGGLATTRLAGVPATSGSATQAGSVLGEILHTLILGELAAHSHNNQVNQTGVTVDPIGTGITFSAALAVGVVVGSTYSLAGGVGPGTVALGYNDPHHSHAISDPSHDHGMDDSGSSIAHNNTGLVMTGTHYFKL